MGEANQIENSFSKVKFQSCTKCKNMLDSSDPKSTKYSYGDEGNIWSRLHPHLNSDGSDDENILLVCVCYDLQGKLRNPH